MAYRSGTYVAFHAGGHPNAILTDLRFYNLLKAWHKRDCIDFRMVDSHEKAGVRDDSSRQQLKRVLAERLRNSRNMVLVLTRMTALDDDWVPFEIGYAIDTCKIPIIAAYPGYDYVQAPADLSALWPHALATRIRSASAHVIHVPFRQEPLRDAILSFGPDKYPGGQGLTYYSPEAYASWGINTRSFANYILRGADVKHNRRSLTS